MVVAGVGVAGVSSGTFHARMSLNPCGIPASQASANGRFGLRSVMPGPMANRPAHMLARGCLFGRPRRDIRSRPLNSSPELAKSI